MLAKIYSAALQGIDAVLVETEVNATGHGEETRVTIVGLPDTAVRESRMRVASALYASGFMHPHGFTTINLAPADIKKEGSHFDLPIALGLIAGSGTFEGTDIESVLVVGELALDGAVRPTRGTLAMAMLAREAGKQIIIVPKANAAEAGVVTGIDVIGVRSLAEAAAVLSGEGGPAPTRVDLESCFRKGRHTSHDLGDIKGQELVKRAIEVAAAGGHNILLIGPPGTGKSMIAQRLPSVLPLMTVEEALETTRVHSIAGQLTTGQPLVVERPFRSPHHTISDAGLLGGQSSPHPGEISLAHNGVLFLDELPEFKRNVLETLRQPLEHGEVTISRAAGSVTFPSSFQLVAAMNPCPCGYYGSFMRQCRCNSSIIQRYRARISGPLLDRIDIHVEVAQLSEQELMSRPAGETSADIRARVLRARVLQDRRFEGSSARCNATMSPAEIQTHCELDRESRQVLTVALRDLSLSARAYDRILRTSLTIADLEGAAGIGVEHVSEAIQYRALDRQLW